MSDIQTICGTVIMLGLIWAFVALFTGYDRETVKILKIALKKIMDEEDNYGK
jgi:hypothetical protein